MNRKLFFLSIAFGVMGCLDLYAFSDSPISGPNKGRMLIVSNSPEELEEPGLLMDESFEKLSRLRVMYYHKNVTKRPLYFQLVVQNLESYAVTLSVKSALGGPCMDGIFAGHRVVQDFLSQVLVGSSSKISLKAGESLVLASHLIKPNQVSTAILDIDHTRGQKAQVKMVVMDPRFPQLSALNRSQKGKAFEVGHYAQTEIMVTKNLEVGSLIQELPIGASPFLQDTVTGQELKGNYGVLYDLKLTLHNTTHERKKINLLFSPLAGMASGYFLVQNEGIETTLIKNPLKEHPQKIYSVSVGPESQKELRIRTIPQPGSFYPIQLVLQHD